MKLVTVIGARPQFIKAAPVSRALRAHGGIQEFLLHTGQHYDANMSQVFFDELEIPRPDLDLQVGSGSHAEQTARMLTGIEAALLREKPDRVLVYGDTNSTLAGALAAAKLQLPVAHVEAGLRSFNPRMPEEINRVLTDHCADLLLAPTRAAVANLRREGVPDERIALVGDVMYDAALFYAERAAQRSRILSDLALEPGRYVLATVHRAENTDVPGRLAAILEGLGEIAREEPVVLPLHPRTRARIGSASQSALRRLRVIDPVGYLDMVLLERHAALIATDSGGVQKEAYFHGVPCVTLRDETEWVELVELGWNRLAPPTSAAAVAAPIRAALGAPRPEPDAARPYGHGHAAEAIRDVLVAGTTASASAAGS
jgi:UDP-GlcNAc3NAcA epimerase